MSNERDVPILRPELERLEPRLLLSATYTELVGANLPDVKDGFASWGDYDGDGDLDVLLSGISGPPSREVISRVYRNDGGAFVDIGAGLSEVYLSAGSWGDYDNDGDLDILLTGNSHSPDWQSTSKVYRNDDGVFVDIGAALQGIYKGSCAWGDYDNDGDLDILLAGWTGSDRVTSLYRNDAGVFVEVATTLPSVESGSVDWEDYDGDGDLDILLTGMGDAGPVSRLYRNNDGIFTDTQTTLSQVSRSDAAWGDFDADGDPDLLLTGWTESQRIATIYENIDGELIALAGGEIFSIDLLPVEFSSVGWGDYDNDGDLDILLAGTTESLSVSYVYRNDESGFQLVDQGLVGVDSGSAAWGDFDGDGDLDILLTGNNSGEGVSAIYICEGVVANTAPTVPQNMAVSYNVDDSRITFSWNAATDAETASAALTYNMRIGLMPGGQEVLSAMGDLAGGNRFLAAPGNVGQSLSWASTSFATNTAYYYSVQAVDGGFAASQWTTEQTITLASKGPAAPLGLSGVAYLTEVDLAWQDQSDNEDGFKIERRLGLSGTWFQIALLGVGDTTYRDSGLAQNTSYGYRVRAFNTAVDSPYGNEIQATTLEEPPVAPSNLTAAGRSFERITLNWTDESSNEEGFEIETYVGGQWAPLDTVGSNVIEYENTSLAADATYSYRVRAYNSVGTTLYTNEASATTMAIRVLLDGADIGDGQADPVNLGSMPFGGGALSRSITVRNESGRAVSLSDLTLPAGFTLVDGLSSELAAGATDTFTVRMENSTVGTRSGEVSFVFDGDAANPFNFPITASITALPAEITVLLEGENIVNGLSIPFVFGLVEHNAPSPVMTFTLSNDGQLPLMLGGLILPTGFVLEGSFPAQLTGGQSATFTIRLDSAVVGDHAGQVSFDTNDGDENPFQFAISGQVTALPAEVAVWCTGVPIQSGQASAVDFGSTERFMSEPIKMFTVRNTGEQPLVLGLVKLPAGFTLVEGLDDTLAAGADDTFVVRMDTDMVGTFTGLLNFSTNDADENPFRFTITGEVAEFSPEIAVWQSGSPIFDNQIVTIDFGVAIAGQGVIEKIFTVRNNGNDTLTLGGISLPNGFSLSEGLSSTLAAGADDTFTIRMQTSAVGTFGGQLSFATNDADEDPFNFAITGQVSVNSPEISVQLSGSNISNNQASAINFGTVLLDAGPVEKTFTVSNIGTDTLSLDSVLLPNGFSLSEGLSTTLASGASDTFTVRMATDTTGTFTGQLSFATNDADESPFRFNISGQVNARSPEISVQLSGNNISNNRVSPVNFGTVLLGTSPAEKTFTVSNNGTDTLSLGSVLLPAGFSLSEGLSVTIVAGASDTFTVRMATGSLGTFGGTLSFATNDADEDPFHFNLRGIVEEPSVGAGPVELTNPSGAATVSVGEVYRIEWSGGAANETVLLRSHGPNGTQIIASGIVATAGSFNWNTTGLPIGSYSISASITPAGGAGYASFSTGQITLVSSVNQVPVASALSEQIAPGETLISAVSAVDGDSDPLVFSIVSAPSHGAVVMEVDGSFLYAPAPEWTGGDSFTFVANDGKQDSNIATVTISSGRIVLLDAKGNAKFVDADGDSVTVSLRGGGSGTLYFNGEGQSDLSKLVLTGTGEKSSLSIKTKGKAGTTVGSILVEGGSLKAIKAKTTDLVGAGIEVTGGWVRAIQIRNVTGGADIIIDGAGPKAMSIKAGRLGAGTDLILSSGVKSITVIEWLGGTLSGPWISSLSIKGDRKNGVRGDLGANLNLTSQNAKGVSLGKLSVAGQIAGSQMVLAASAGSIKAAQWQGGSFSATWLKSLTLKGNKRDPLLEGDLSAEITLHGANAKGLSIGKLTTFGTAINSTIRTFGGTGGLTFAALMGSDLLVGIADDVERHAADSGDFINPSATIKSIKIKGRKGEGGLFLVDSHFSAARFGKVALLNVEFTEGDSVIYALKAAGEDAVGKVTYKDTQSGAKWSWPPKGDQVFAGGEVVRLL